MLFKLIELCATLGARHTYAAGATLGARHTYAAGATQQPGFELQDRPNGFAAQDSVDSATSFGIAEVVERDPAFAKAPSSFAKTPQASGLQLGHSIATQS